MRQDLHAWYAQHQDQPLWDSDEPDIKQATVGSQSSGRMIIFQIRLSDGRISACRFKVFGCPYTIAACVWLEQQLVNQPYEALASVNIAASMADLQMPKTKQQVTVLLDNIVEYLTR